MNVTAWILGIVLAAGFGIGGVTKLLDLDRVRDHLGYAKRQFQLIGLAELAGAVALIVGLAWPKFEWIGLAAGVGICSLMFGAMIAHARVEDEGKKIIPAIAVFVLTVAYMVVISLR